MNEQDNSIKNIEKNIGQKGKVLDFQLVFVKKIENEINRELRIEKIQDMISGGDDVS